MKNENIISHYDRLKARRSTWEDSWKSVADLTIPRKNDVFCSTVANRLRGEIKTTMYDSTAPHSADLLASALHSMLTNPSLPFFELTTGNLNLDKIDEIRKWLQACQRIIHSVLANSNFQTQIHEVYLDLVTLGTTLLRMLEDAKSLIRFETIPVYNAYIDENNRGEIDTVYRKFSWTIRQICQEWGEESLSEDLKKIKMSNPLEEVEILHAVYPREDKFIDKKKGPKGKPFVSKYLTIADRHTLSEGGFDEFPYAAPRWTKAAGEIYGRSPAMKCLADIRMINAMKKTTIRSAQKVVDPPMQAPDDGIALPIKTNANALNYYRRGSKDRIEPILTGGRVDFGFQAMAEIKTSINEAFFIDRLQLSDGPQMTATEVNQRTEENLRVLGPLLGRMHSELLAPLIVRIFGILTRKKMLPEPPIELQGSELQVRYSSMIAKAQRTGEGQNLNRALQDVGILVQSNPQLLDNIDGDVALRNALRLHGVSEDEIRSEQDRDKDREAKAQMMEEQRQREVEAQEIEQAAKLGVANV